jgi:DNA-binding transcriptional regulator YiaG
MLAVAGAPQGPARALLRIIDRAPETVLQALDRP